MPGSDALFSSSKPLRDSKHDSGWGSGESCFLLIFLTFNKEIAMAASVFFQGAVNARMSDDLHLEGMSRRTHDG